MVGGAPKQMKLEWLATNMAGPRTESKWCAPSTVNGLKYRLASFR